MSAVGTPRTSRRLSALGRLGRQRGVGAHQHQPEDVVLDEAAAVGHGACALLPALGVGEEHRQLARATLLGAEPVEHPPPRGGHQPAGGVVGRAVDGPRAARRLDRVAQRVLDEVEPAELRQEQGHQPAPLLSHDLARGRRPGPRSGRHVDGRVDLDVVGRQQLQQLHERRRGRAPRRGRTRPCPRSPRRRGRRSARPGPPSYASRWRRAGRSAPRRRAARRRRAPRTPRRTRRTSPSRRPARPRSGRARASPPRRRSAAPGTS